MFNIDHDFVDDLEDENTRAVVEERLAFDEGNDALGGAVLLQLVREGEDVGAAQDTPQQKRFNPRVGRLYLGERYLVVVEEDLDAGHDEERC